MKKEEIWKDIIGYEGHYQVSDLGNIKSLERKSSNGKFIKERILKQTTDNYLYCKVDLYKNGKQVNKKVHQLVAESFLNHVPCGHKLVVNHINFIKTDNRLKNLEIVTQRENANMKHLKSTSKYTGVSWDKQSKKWHSKIYTNNKQKHLGMFANEYDAHLAYQKELEIVNSQL